jgi:hypothetical protein
VLTCNASVLKNDIPRLNYVTALILRHKNKTANDKLHTLGGPMLGTTRQVALLRVEK